MRRLFGLLVLMCSVATLPQPAAALYRGGEFGDMDISGRLRTSNIVRHRNLDSLAFIMQRNELRLRFEWKWLQRGKMFNRYKNSWFERSDVFLLYRGTYDSVYDFTPGGIHDKTDLQGDRFDERGGPAFLSLDNDLTQQQRQAAKFENRIREWYVDLYLKNIPLTLRIGRQQIVWGESDGFRMLDRANTLDLGWHFFQELPPPGYGFDDLRKPFFNVKALWDFKQLGPLSQPFLEAYWNPGDWDPGSIKFLPHPWGVKLLDPIENTRGSGVLQAYGPCNLPGNSCDGLMGGTELFRNGGWKRNPLENSQFGVRFHFITPQGFEMTFNYLYQRWSPDGSPTAVVRGVPSDKTFFVPDTVGFIPGNQPGTLTANEYCTGLFQSPQVSPWSQNELCIEYFAPYIHTIGWSMNFFESNFTQTVWRVETVFDFDLPFYDGDKQVALFGRSGGNEPILLPGITNKHMWKGMIAFDRPTWIKWLNKQTTFFITGQLFWHYIVDHKPRRCAIGDDPANGYTSSYQENCGDNDNLFLPGESMGLVGPFDLPKLDAPSGKTRDTIHQWELLMTLAVLGFYKGGSLVPAFIYLLDPVNSYSQEVALGLDWFIRPDISFNITTRLIWAGLPWDAYKGHKSGINGCRGDGRRNVDGSPTNECVDRGQIFDPWFLAGGSRGRSETGIQFTWQF